MIDFSQRDKTAWMARVALDMAQISQGHWVSNDVLCLGQWVGHDEQATLEAAFSSKVDDTYLRELAMHSIGKMNLLPMTGMHDGQLRAIQHAYESDPQGMIATLREAVEKQTQCRLRNVVFDFS